MITCIAEKPSVAAEIAKILGANSRQAGYYMGNDYAVTWVFGHLCELKEPHDYKKIWKSWNPYDLPIIPDRFDIKLKDDAGVAKQFNIIKGLISKSERVINCGDAGQEGELIQRWVLLMAETKCPVQRLWISSLTEESIREGFNNLRDSHDFDNLFLAGYARAVSDWLLGMNATRAYTIRYGGYGQVLSIGRVQTPTLALIVRRQEEIDNFKPETYWELKTVYRATTFSATSGKFSKKEEAEAALQTIVGFPLTITDVGKKESNEAPPRLYDLTALQVDCNKKYSFSADETLKLIQLLYEKKLTTYPRVDTTYLSEDLHDKIPSVMRGLTPYANFTAPVLAEKIKKTKRIFDNSKVTDHHAIIPTGVTPSSDLSRNEKLVFDLVARRFIANFWPDCKVSTTTVNADVNKVGFKTTGREILSYGWRTVYGEDKKGQVADSEEGENAILPTFVVGESGAHEPGLKERQTTPPKPYTEATLLRAMETAGKQVEDEELRDLMKDNGIGRPSTRAAIIETLFRRKYIVKERKNLIPTTTGKNLINIIHIDLLKSVELTGQWEKKLRMIDKGEYNANDFVGEMKSLVGQIVEFVARDTTSARFEGAPAEEPKKKAPSAKKSTAKKEAEPVDISTLRCPLCGGSIARGKAAWGCLNYANGCKFVVPFEFMHKRLTFTHLVVLTQKRKTRKLDGFIDENGAKISGSICVEDDGRLLLV